MFDLKQRNIRVSANIREAKALVFGEETEPDTIVNVIVSGFRRAVWQDLWRGTVRYSSYKSTYIILV